MIYIPFILSDEQQGIAASSVNQFIAVVWYSGIVREVDTRIRTIWSLKYVFVLFFFGQIYQR